MSSIVISSALPVGSGGSAVLNKPIQFRVGDGALHSPVAGDVSYINPALAGKSKFIIYRESVGRPIQEITEFTYRVTGGFDLVGSVMVDTELYTLSNY